MSPPQDVQKALGNGMTDSSSGHRLPLGVRAYLELRERIITLRLAPGQLLRERELAEALGIGLTPIREALRRLARERLVVMFPRQGTIVSEINIKDPLHVGEVRAPLEGLAAKLAARRATSEQRATIEETLKRVTEAEGAQLEPRELLALDSGAHRCIYAAANNPMLASTLDEYYNLAARIWYAMSDRLPAEHLNSAMTSHNELLTAILAGEAERAAELASEHVSTFTEAVQDIRL